MVNVALVNTITKTAGKLAFQLKKNAPAILAVSGAAITAFGTYKACKATLKVSPVIEDAKRDIEIIHEAAERGITVNGEEYSSADEKKDLTRTYVKTGIQVAKTYGPAVGAVALGIGCMLTSSGMLHKRNVALASAFATVDKSFKEYRGRVINRFGEQVDRELKYNIKAKKLTETVRDEETGKEKKVKLIKQYCNPDDVSGYARFFDEFSRNDKGEVVKNPCWDRNNEYNLMFLKAQQSYANDLLISKGRLFLNEVYQMLGIPVSKAGQVVGWVYDPKNPEGDNYVDFGIYASADNYSDFVYSDTEAILLDFNVDGNIWETM